MPVSEGEACCKFHFSVSDLLTMVCLLERKEGQGHFSNKIALGLPEAAERVEYLFSMLWWHVSFSICQVTTVDSSRNLLKIVLWQRDRISGAWQAFHGLSYQSIDFCLSESSSLTQPGNRWCLSFKKKKKDTIPTISNFLNYFYDSLNKCSLRACHLLEIALDPIKHFKNE